MVVPEASPASHRTWIGISADQAFIIDKLAGVIRRAPGDFLAWLSQLD